jgi:hypothetical protein
MPLVIRHPARTRFHPDHSAGADQWKNIDGPPQFTSFWLAAPKSPDPGPIAARARDPSLRFWSHIEDRLSLRLDARPPITG